MSIRDRVAAVLAFNTIPTTVLLVLIYAAIFSTVLVTDNLPAVPKNTRGLALDQAWLDLHQVSARPHPFNSHANDLVREYIRDRLGDVASPAGGFLLSAHFDSVSTASGTTDDSMGVVTLMQMVEPRRTVIFNINNGEEDGLNGAHAFMEHPWANISDVFLNLEGAAAGGRPVMFRATATAPLYSWTGDHVPHPHANVLFAEAFARGVIRSGTDYSVYEQAGLHGLDFAFYRGRSRYHTKYDSIPGMEGGKRALWAMMEGTRGAMFGAALVVFSLETLFHIVRLGRGIRHRHRSRAGANVNHRNETMSERTLSALKKVGTGLWDLAKFWAALVVTVGLQAALIVGYVNINPFILHSHPLLVLISVLTLAYLTTVLVLAFPLNKHGIVPAPELQKHSILLQTYVFTWLLLVFSTVVLRKIEIGSSYWITAWNAGVLLGSIVAYVEGMTSARGFEPENGTEPEGQRYVGAPTSTQMGSKHPELLQDPQPTEITPLVRRERSLPPRPAEGEQGAIGWWILQLLLVVPVPVILVLHIAIMVLGAVGQTLTDGNDPVSISTLIRLLTFIVLAIFVLSTVYAWVVFPFSQKSPLKVYFAQSKSNVVVTTLTGPKQFLASHILTELPSAFGKSVECYDAPDKPGLQTCSWEVGDEMVPSPGGRKVNSSEIEKPWVSSSVVRTGSNSARITVRGLNSRSCTVQLADQRISKFMVIGDGEKGLQEGYEIPEKGLQQIRLWSRDFGKVFEVEVEWKDGDTSEGDTKGSITCGWAEYESATVGGGRTGGKIPSLEEVLQFLPEWAVVTKANAALFDAGISFSI
ncbi:hypothetical protein BU15DRAFT_88557 [Melanogaster broomeanus]|nr:hypothetical protein BU15DRAFT_88557 [Melanogaster broomeanus]